MALIPQAIAYKELLVVLYSISRGVGYGLGVIPASLGLVFAGLFAIVSLALKFGSKVLVGRFNTFKTELLAGGAALVGLGLFLRLVQRAVSRALRPMSDDTATIVVAWGGVVIVAALVGGLTAIFMGLPRRDPNNTGGVLRILPKT